MMYKICASAVLAASMTATGLAQQPSMEASVRGDNAEMTAIFQADQAIRQEITPEKVKDSEFLKKMFLGDRDRRKRTDELLASGTLNSADDYYHAAFIYQHGDDANSYLLAHTLAVAAAARGHAKASWIAAATLDRYLQEIGQPQVYGTQYSTIAGEPTTMEPYDRTLVPDALRTSLGVPVQAAQEEKLAELRKQHAD